MNLDDLREMIVRAATNDGVDPKALERLALRLITEMPSEPRSEIVTISEGLSYSDWSYVADKAARAIQLAADWLREDDSRKPPRVKPRLKSMPKVREIFWCDFQTDAQLPELWKRRPVVVASFRQTLHSAVTVIPCSSLEQDQNKWSVKLSISIDGKASWAICDKLTTVAVSRLSADKHGIKRLEEPEFQSLLRVAYNWLPALADEKSETK